jgi:formylmethanofuran dehydrogenase subunit E
MTFYTEREDFMPTAITSELIQKTIDFHGHWCPGLAIGIRAAEWALQEMGRAPDEEIVVVVETDMCGVDAIQYLTGCTFGKGNLIHKDYGKNAFSFYRREDGKAARIVARSDIYGDSVATMRKLHRKMVVEGLTQEEEKVWHETRAAVAKHIMESNLTDLFDFKTAVEPVPQMARLIAPMVCESCGETVMETRTRHFGGQLLCIPCFETREKR